MKTNHDQSSIITEKYEVLKPMLSEPLRRLWAAVEARALGRGGVTLVSRATGLSRTTITSGLAELRQPGGANTEPIRRNRRRPGGGRKRLVEKDSALLAALDRLVEPTTRGDPQCPLRWTCKSTRLLAAELRRQGWRIGDRTVANLLKELDYSLQSTRKTREGTDHPDRDAQFRYIHDRVLAFQLMDQPVISIDANKKEHVGNFSNHGKEWQPTGNPEQVNVHDFPQPDLGKAIPYGVYDVTMNQGWVSVGVDHDTSQFAGATIRRWWEMMGREVYPHAQELLIIADGGGSNGVRSRLWKVIVQELADLLDLRISICHFPPGTSKWNKIEHRMFCWITKNWRGRPLSSLEVIVHLIGSTTTEAGLEVKAAIDRGTYPIGISISDEELKQVRIVRDDFHGEWNYAILPRKSK